MKGSQQLGERSEPVMKNDSRPDVKSSGNGVKELKARPAKLQRMSATPAKTFSSCSDYSSSNPIEIVDVVQANSPVDLIDLTEEPIMVVDTGMVSSRRKRKHGWPKLLGRCVVKAESTTCTKDCSSYLRPAVKLKVNAQTVLPPSGTPTKRNSSKPTARRSLKSSATTSARKRKRAVSSTHKTAFIVRLSAMDPRCASKEDITFARLPKKLAELLCPLMNTGWITVNSVCVWSPRELRPFTKIEVSLEFLLSSPEVFAISEDVVEKQLPYDPQTMTFLKDCFYNLLLEIQPELNPLQFPQVLPLPTDSSSKTLIVEDNDIEDAEMPVSRLKTLCNALTVDLRPHQLKALHWMLEREAKEKEDLLHPLWTKVNFDRNAGSSENWLTFYINVYTKEISLSAPTVPEVCRGGILADEMGLGKTISVLALIVASNAAKDVGTVDGPTLVVCPTSLVGQWNKEIKDKVKLPIEVSRSVQSCEEVETVSSMDDDQSVRTLLDTELIPHGGSETSEVECPLDTEVKALLNEKEKQNQALHKSSLGSRNGALALKVLVYHGTGRKRVIPDFSKYDVVLTTYGIVAEEFDKRETKAHLSNRSLPSLIPKQKKKIGRHSSKVGRSDAKHQTSTTNHTQETVLDGDNSVIDVEACASDEMRGEAEEGRHEDRPLAGNSLGLHEFPWFRIVLDEGHLIKNTKTNLFSSCYSLKTKEEWNKRWILTGTPVQNGLDDLFALLKFVRLQPWCNETWWKKVISQPFEAGKRASVMGTIQQILDTGPVLLRRTKRTTEGFDVKLPPKIMNHVDLTFSLGEEEYYSTLLKKSIAEFNGYMKSRNAKRHYAQIFTLLLRLRQCCNHPYLTVARAEDSDKVKAGTILRKISKKLQRFDKVDTEYVQKQVKQFLMKSKRIFSNEEQVSSAAAAEKVGSGPKPAHQSECPVCLDTEYVDPVVTSCGHIMCRACISNSLVYFKKSECPICREHVDPKSLISVTTDTSEVEEMKQLTKDTKAKLSTKMEWLVKSLQEVSQMNSESCTGELQRLRQEHLADEDDDVLKAPLKVIIFSQWTLFLDMLETVLKTEKLRYTRLDGAMNRMKREAAIEMFSNDSRVNVFLVSLKAGALGLNLTCASIIYLLDPWFNPAIEEQAINRCHRIGQTRPVMIHRLYMTNTVEMKIKDMQLNKLRLAGEVLQEKTNSDLDDNFPAQQKGLTFDQLASFFR